MSTFKRFASVFTKKNRMLTPFRIKIVLIPYTALRNVTDRSDNPTGGTENGDYHQDTPEGIATKHIVCALF